MSKLETQRAKTDVTSLKLYKNFLLAGIGNQLHTFDLKTNTLKYVWTCFDGLRIHGIQVNPTGTHLLLNAENELLLVRMQISDTCCPTDWYAIDRRIETDDWILTTKWLQYNNFAYVTMHNKVEFLNDETLTLAYKTCDTKCILYCAEICYETIRDCVILCGTVFSEILIWRPYFSGEVYHRLKGHEGVLFSIEMFNSHILTTSDDRSVILWQVHGDLREKTCTLSLQTKMHGHTARVFRCKLLKDCLMSSGEDGRVCLWDYAGNLKKSFNLHHGGSVWSIESDGNIILSGGSNSSIIRIPLELGYGQNTKLKMFDQETLKKLVQLYNEDIVVVTENGSLLHYNKKKNSFQSSGLFEEFKSYALLVVSTCRKKFALGNNCGHIRIYTCRDTLIEQCRFTIPNKKRFFSLHWLSCNHLLACGPEGALYLLKLHKHNQQNCLLLIGKYELPASKERWSTAACHIPGVGFAVGDRKGNLYLFDAHHSIPKFTIKKAHSHLGITSLHWDNNNKILVSMGRNSIYQTFKLKVTGKRFDIIPLTADVLPFSWIGMKLPHENVLLGFSGNEMLLWDCDKRIELFRANCGGGHRSWDANAHNFIYIRDKAVHAVRLTRPIELASSTHSTEINAVQYVQIHDKLFLISGGEDTTLRFSMCSFRNVSLDLVNVATIKSHLSSVRCLELIPFEKAAFDSNDSNRYYQMFSAGGRGQIIYWRLAFTEIGEYLYCQKLHSYFEPQDEDTRIMDITVSSVNINNKQLLFAGCSDGSVKIYSVFGEKLELYKTIYYQLRCILKICIVPLNVNNCDKPLLVTMATDGILCFWDLNELKQFNNHSGPFFKFSVHQSGINCYDFRIIKEDTFLFLTGGDDNQISLVIFKYENDTLKMQHHYSNIASHCAQITGVYLSNEYFFTVSLDQMLLSHKYDIADELQVFYKDCYKTAISDVKGINVLKDNVQFIIVLHGLGIELIKCQTLQIC